MAEGGGTIGRANVELGANTAPLEAGLTAAKQEVVQSVKEIQQAATVDVGDDSERYQQRLQEMAGAQAMERAALIREDAEKDRADRAARERAKERDRQSAANAAAAAKQATQKEFAAYIDGLRKQKDAVEDVTKAEKKRVDNAREGGEDRFRFGAAKAAAIGLIGAVQQLFFGIKQATSAGDEFAASMRSIEDAFRTDTAAGLDPFTRRREEIEKTKKALLEQIRIQEMQRNLIQDIVALTTGNAESEAQRQKIMQEAADAQQRLIRTTEQNAKKAREEQQQKEQEEARADLRASAAKINLARKRAEDEARIREEAEIAANARIEADRLKRAQENMQALIAAQREQFAALRNDINSLFNTGQLEIGINRLSALMEILVQKVGDQR